MIALLKKGRLLGQLAYISILLKLIKETMAAVLLLACLIGCTQSGVGKMNEGRLSSLEIRKKFESILDESSCLEFEISLPSAIRDSVSDEIIGYVELVRFKDSSIKDSILAMQRFSKDERNVVLFDLLKSAPTIQAWSSNVLLFYYNLADGKHLEMFEDDCLKWETDGRLESIEFWKRRLKNAPE